uniref:ATP synthase complex subunit 8 n=1 Tax=Oxypoda acuminata TaxID=346815 RepID=A0A0S2M7X9_9COLE|nr:ATP synthase F0 subunit 8 [Oxypoda acuminata]ALO70815.1 ATP synthase F0 subunit 8 [Oxypoda acuminata]
MPQMAPMNWLTLFIFMITIFLLFNSLNYFSFMYSNKTTANKNPKIFNINWKW